MNLSANIIKILLASALAVFSFAATSASAASCTSYPSGDTDNLTTSTDCALPGVGPGGNPSLALMSGLFGVADWTTDFGTLNTTNGSDNLSNAFFSVTSNAGNTSGTWSLISGFSFDPTKIYALVLKGGSNGSIAYKLDTSFTSGDWTNADIPLNGGGNTPGLSNIRLYSTGPLSTIPLPAAGWLLIAGLGGLAAMRRRRKA